MTVRLAKILTSSRLPTLPQVALRVIELVNCDQPDLNKIAETIKGDPAISAKIIRTVNSALFGLRQNVSSIEQALPILGCSLVRTLVL